MAEKRRVGILGGTFNPIHMGHLLMAEQAKEEFALDQIIFIPVGNPPHKDLSNAIPDADRVAMTQLAIQDNSAFSIDLFEIEKQETCYTYETLQHFATQNPNTEYYFILGADSLFYFHKWCHPESICKYSTILAAVRDDRDMGAVLDKIEELNQVYDTKMYPLQMPSVALSSTDIRKRVCKGQSIRYRVPEKVEQYIHTHHLYRSHFTGLQEHL